MKRGERVVVNLSGRGDKDMQSVQEYLAENERER